MSESISKTKKNIQLIGLALFLVIIPGMSWYFLKAGFNYNKELMNELKNYGRIPAFTLVNQNSDTLQRKDVEGKVMVVDFFNPEAPTYKAMFDFIHRLDGQFHDRKDMVFLHHAYSADINSIAQLKQLAKSLKLDTEQHHFLLSDDPEALIASYQIPEFDNRQEDKTYNRSKDVKELNGNFPVFILTDVSGTVRNYYKSDNEEDVTRLVEHLALILPRKMEEEAEKKMATEK